VIGIAGGPGLAFGPRMNANKLFSFCYIEEAQSFQIQNSDCGVRSVLTQNVGPAGTHVERPRPHLGSRLSQNLSTQRRCRSQLGPPLLR